MANGGSLGVRPTVNGLDTCLMHVEVYELVCVLRCLKEGMAHLFFAAIQLRSDASYPVYVYPCIRSLCVGVDLNEDSFSFFFFSVFSRNFDISRFFPYRKMPEKKEKRSSLRSRPLCVYACTHHVVGNATPLKTLVA